MFHRIVNPLKSRSFFLIGCRGTGKSTYVLKQFAKDARFLYLDLLDPETEDRLVRNPSELTTMIQSTPKKPEWVIIDEVQKSPKLLNVVHQLIEREKTKFILTGSSARKLRRGAANLLAGRAFLNFLFPLTFLELADSFDLKKSLQFGTLPSIFSFQSDAEKIAYLKSYCFAYLREEIQVEQLVRDVPPFRDFLRIAAQMSGKILNMAGIAEDVGVDAKTVKNYFSILEDTMIGFFLPSFHRSIRKSQKVAPKFFLFDLGVRNSLAESIESVPSFSTSYFGELFEHFVILESFRLNHYSQRDYRFSYLMTKNNFEVDLILSKGVKDILVEIKSTDRIDVAEVEKLSRNTSDFKNVQLRYYVSRDPEKRKIGDVTCLHWKDFLNEIFGK